MNTTKLAQSLQKSSSFNRLVPPFPTSSAAISQESTAQVDVCVVPSQKQAWKLACKRSTPSLVTELVEHQECLHLTPCSHQCHHQCHTPKVNNTPPDTSTLILATIHPGILQLAPSLAVLLHLRRRQWSPSNLITHLYTTAVSHRPPPSHFRTTLNTLTLLVLVVYNTSLLTHSLVPCLTPCPAPTDPLTPHPNINTTSDAAGAIAALSSTSFQLPLSSTYHNTMVRHVTTRCTAPRWAIGPAHVTTHHRPEWQAHSCGLMPGLDVSDQLV